MPSTEQILFNNLKKEIAETFRKTYPSCDISIEDWKGQDIENFQEELILKVKGRISEKWFYTHIKSESDKLPRIDMLNMLSQYVGYQDWRDFTNKQKDLTKETEEKAPIIEKIVSDSTPIHSKNEKAAEFISPSVKKGKSAIWMIIIGTVALLILTFIIFREKSKTYKCCFTDINGSALVPNAKIEVRLLKDHESPITIVCDNNGCFEFNTNQKSIEFFVNSPYYKADTIIRSLNESLTEERIKLKTNDYALMIHYFSTSNINDWKQRRMHLEDMIARDAKIIQVYIDGSGMELYNKEEFINKLTMPLKSLKNIEIIETRYSENQITLLRFMQIEKKE